MKRIFLATLAAAAIPLSAQASDLDYTFVQGGYGYSHNDSGPNAHGWSGQGQFAIGPNFYLSGSAGRTQEDGFNGHFGSWSLGGGFHTPIAAQTDFVAEGRYAQETVSGVSGDTRVWAGDVGVRSALASHFEGWANVGYQNAREDFDGIEEPNSKGSAYGTLGGEYKFNKNVGLVTQVKFVTGDQQIFVGPRINF